MEYMIINPSLDIIVVPGAGGEPVLGHLPHRGLALVQRHYGATHRALTPTIWPW